MNSSAGAFPRILPLLNNRFEIIISCEHGGSDIPPQYLPLFRGKKTLLRSHKSYDPGSLDLAKHIAAALDAPLYYATISRLLVDLNRSPGHRNLFSEITGKLKESEKQQILSAHYYPYRRRIESAVSSCISRRGRILHISAHTFTPVLDGIKRRADIGLLYDPSRKEERSLCVRWQKALTDEAPGLVVRRNYPYLGRADGLITFLRKRFPHDSYIGIELEINQKHHQGSKVKWRSLKEKILKAMAASLA